MTAKKLIYYILAGFVIGTLLLVYIQYNSAKNINQLITGNEQLLNELSVSNELKELEKDVQAVETRIRTTVTSQDSTQIDGLETQIGKIETDLDQLQRISDDDSSVKYIDKLDELVREKLKFSHQLLDSLRIAGKDASKNLVASQESGLLTDSIAATILRIDSTRKNLLANVTRSIDKSGKSALRFSTILIVLVLISAAILFWYIINIIRRQVQLINELNISEKKVRETALVKENFMANMSHEIRTPMNAILGFTNLLQRKELDPDSTVYVQTIQQSGESLLHIINDILDLSKIEAGMMRIESAPFSIRQLLDSVKAMFNDEAKRKKIQLSSSVDSSVPEILEGDATRLTQVLVNLLGNSMKFTNQGTITIQITNEGRHEGMIKTVFTITDTGIGIDQQQLKYIFERFRQADDAVTRKYGGTGLGLAIVHDLVQLQQGTINVESEPGIGTTFKLVIPYQVSSVKANSIPSTRNVSPPTLTFEQTKILLVEDNEINQLLIQHLFGDWKVDFDIAVNGKKAIELLQKNKYDLVLLDIQMPEMDGYTTVHEIRNTLQLSTPVIAMTAHALSGEREKCLSLGMNEYLSKPISEEQLYSLIRQFTRMDTAVGRSKRNGATDITGNYSFINLDYMKEISLGDMNYEKTVTEQFIEAIPEDLDALEKAWQQNDSKTLRQLAHNMRTTLSIMGLTEILKVNLDALEYETLDRDQVKQHIDWLNQICTNALAESKEFLKSL